MPKTIVWIEDDIDVIYSVVKPLESAGYEFIRIYNAKDALSPENVEIIRDADLLLLDLMIPPAGRQYDADEMPGVDVLRKLRQEHRVQTPVVVFSVSHSVRILEQLETCSIADFIRKPVRPSELKARITKILE